MKCLCHGLPAWNSNAEKEYRSLAFVFNNIDKREQRALMEAIPDKIFDAHVHTCPAEAVTSRDPRIANRLMSSFPHFDYEDSSKVDRLVWPGKDIAKLRIPTPYYGIDPSAANKYLHDLKHNGGWALLGARDNPAYTMQQLVMYDGSYSALKMYPFSEGTQENTVYSIFPKEILEFCNDKKLPIIFHLPAQVSKLQGELEQLMKDFPQVPVVLAHVALLGEQPANQRNDDYNALRSLAKYPNCHVDTAVVNDWEVILFALRTFGPDRVMYGSDEPLSMVRATPFHHPEMGPWMSAGGAYHWIKADDKFVCEVAVEKSPLLVWSGLRAAVTACEGYEKDHTEVAEKVFFKNARRVFLKQEEGPAPAP